MVMANDTVQPENKNTALKIFLIIVIVILALLGPAIGHIFSNVVVAI
jgi:nitrate reductase NapE component